MGNKSLKDEVFACIKKKYKVLPEYPWRKYDSNAVFRHADNKKWFALVMEVSGDKLGLRTRHLVTVYLYKNVKHLNKFVKVCDYNISEERI